MSAGLEPIAGTMSGAGDGVRASELFRQLGLREVRREKDELLRRHSRRALTSWEESQLRHCDEALDRLEQLARLTTAPLPDRRQRPPAAPSEGGEA